MFPKRTTGKVASSARYLLEQAHEEEFVTDTDLVFFCTHDSESR